MSAFKLAQINAEMAIAAKLGFPAVFTPATDARVRRRLIRETILDLGLEHHEAGLRDGKRETWTQLYRRMYGEPIRRTKTTEKIHVHT